MKIRSSVLPSGKFTWGIHNPEFKVRNLRENDYISVLGETEDEKPYYNHVNFPSSDPAEKGGRIIYEIPNPFPFLGATYIIKSRADENAKHPLRVSMPDKPMASFFNSLKEWSGDYKFSKKDLKKFMINMPEPFLIAIATSSTDPDDLSVLARIVCEFVRDKYTGEPTGLVYNKDARGNYVPEIQNKSVFKALVNNPALPDNYKNIMVLRPGAQGDSPIVGEWAKDSHVFEYLRTNSYIPGGHYAANMANDHIRYSLENIGLSDIKAMRRLYYQRIYVNLAMSLKISVNKKRKNLSAKDLESLRVKILKKIRQAKKKSGYGATLWGWNYGFDFAPSKYRLHASHQQIHQQYAMIPAEFSSIEGDGKIRPFSYGDLFYDFITQYKKETGKDFFEAYIKAIKSNKRTDRKKNKNKSLIVFEDENIMLFVPKAQTSQWELQIMTKDKVGNIPEADEKTRNSLDMGLFVAAKILDGLGAKMITSIECSKRFDSDNDDQRLLYRLLPKLPYSPGSFTEAQFRWINDHYPEDFATACRAMFESMKA